MPRSVKVGAVLLAVLVLAAVVAALVLPSVIDWNRHRGAIATALAEAVGRPVQLGGDLDVTLLPVPRLAAHDVTIANAAGGQAPVLGHFEALEARLAPGALLGGKIRVRRIRLERPVLHLEILPDGRSNWALASPAQPPGAYGEDTEKAGAGARIALDRLLVEDGILTYHDARSGRGARLDRIDAEISADSLLGPFTARGSLRLHGLPIAFAAKAGTMAEDAPVPAELALRLADSEAALGFEGIVDLAAAPRAEGRLVASGPNLLHTLADMAAAPENVPSRLLARPFRAEAGMTAERGAAALHAARLALGELRAQGTARARFGGTTDIEARLAFAPIDLDGFLHAPLESEPRQGQSKSEERRRKPAFAPPPDLRLALSARAPAIKYRGGVIQDVEILASLADRTATLSRMSARLPGGSTFSLAGAATFPSASGPARAEPLFHGLAEFSSDSLRGFLTWAGLDVGAVPPDRLTRLDFVSRIEAGPGRIALTGIDARLDAAQLSGEVAYRPARPRPLLALDLALDRLNADAYLATRPDSPASVAAAASSAAPARPREEEGGGGPLAMLAAFDGRFTLRIGLLSMRAMPLRGVSVHGTLEAGWLHLDPLLVADASGARILLRGEIGHLADAQGPLLDLQAQLRHDSLADFARSLALPLSPSPAAGGVAVDVTARGTPRALTLAPLAASLGPLRIEGEGVLALAAPRPALTLDVAASALDLDALLGARASGGAGADDISRPAAVAPWSPAPLDLSALALFDADIRGRAERVTWRGWRFGEPVFTLRLRDGTVSLPDATARLFDGALTLDAILQSGTGALSSFAASLRLHGADAAQAAATLIGQPFLTGRLDAAAEIAARGASPYEFVSNLQGTIEFAAEDGVLRGIDLPRLSAQLDELGSGEGLAGLIAASLAGGKTPYRRIGGTAQIRDGVLRTTDMQAEIAAAEADLRAEIDLPRYWLDALCRFRLAEYPDAPAIGLAFIGPLDAPERRIDSEDLRRYAAVHLLRAGIDRLIEDRLSGTGSPDGADAPEHGRQILRGLGGR